MAWMHSFACRCFMFFAAFSFCCAVCVPLGESQAAGAQLSDEQLCLAGLMSKYDWSAETNTKKRNTGVYSHSNDNIHVFRSKFGVLMCRVDRNRIILANARGQWQTGERDVFISYMQYQDKLLVVSRYGDGTTKEASFSKAMLQQRLPVSKTCVPKVN